MKHNQITYKELRKKVSNMIQKIDQLGYESEHMNVQNELVTKYLDGAIKKLEKALKECESTIRDGAE